MDFKQVRFKVGNKFVLLRVTNTIAHLVVTVAQEWYNSLLRYGAVCREGLKRAQYGTLLGRQKHMQQGHLCLSQWLTQGFCSPGLGGGGGFNKFSWGQRER
jgi:hypothetical protein